MFLINRQNFNLMTMLFLMSQKIFNSVIQPKCGSSVAELVCSKSNILQCNLPCEAFIRLNIH